MSADLNLTVSNPDLAGFDLVGMEGLGAFMDGSGGGVRTLAWGMQRLREERERANLLEAFVRKYCLTLARLCWNLEVTVIHPFKKEGEDRDLAVFVPQVDFCAYAYDKKRVTAHEIAALWPEAVWHRTQPRWGPSETERDYTADVDGVLLRIRQAEVLPRVNLVDRFGRCGPVRISKKLKTEN